jgi:K+-sensing histidine kinase KdpD
MVASTKPVQAVEPEIRVPMPEIVKFLRQLGHDLRNHLNAAELQSAYIAELTEDEEMANEIKRLRGMISEIGTSLGRLTSSLAEIRLTLMPYSASDLVDDVRQKLQVSFPKEYPKLEWNLQLGEASLQIDPQLLQPAVIELFANAFQHDRAEGMIPIDCRIENDHFVLEIREPKQKFDHSTENWGLEPLQSVSHGHYGIGLYRSRAIIEAHGGQLSARFDSSAGNFITTVAIPLAKSTD